jgi:hypothetical protein
MGSRKVSESVFGAGQNFKSWATARGLVGTNDGFLLFSRDISYYMNRDGIFGCTEPIVDSLYEVLHNGHEGEVADAPPRKRLA